MKEGQGSRWRRRRKENSRSVAKATRPAENLKFEEFWKAYPVETVQIHGNPQNKNSMRS